MKPVNDLLLSNQHFERSIEGGAIGIAMFSGDDYVIENANAAYCKLIFKTVDEIFGKSLFEILPQNQQEYSPLIEILRQSHQPQFLSELPSVYHDNGETKKDTLI